MATPGGLNTSWTLEQLEGHPWPAPEEGSTPMVERCHALRKVPLGRLTAGDLRLLIGQDIGIRFLMPLALEALETDPLTEAEYYPGDLLSAAMKVGTEYWASHKVERERLLRAAALASQRIAESMEPMVSSHQLRRDIHQFVGTRDT